MRMRGQSTDELEKDTAKFRKASSSVKGSTPSSILRTMQSKEKPEGVQSKSKSSPALAKRSSNRTEETPARTIKSETNRAQTNNSENPQGDLTQQGSLVLDRKKRFEKVVKESTEGLGERKNTLEAKNLIAGAGRDSVQAIVALYTTSKPTPAYSITSVVTSKDPSDDELSDEECLKEEPRTSVPQKNEVHQVANKKEHKVAMVAKEILSSEKVYVGILRLLVNFKQFVEKKKVETKKEIIPPEKLAKIISNIPTILEFNLTLLQDFEDRVANWESHRKIADVLVKKGPFLQLYAQYLNDFDVTSKVFEDSCKNHPNFAKAVKEYESLPECGNLKLSMHMLKPVQRLPQYRLLLNDYLKHQDETSVDFNSTHEALKIVSKATQKANSQLKLGEQFDKMLKLQGRIGDFELIQAGRELLKEGEMMKISRDQVDRRYFILLNDCLLYTHYAVIPDKISSVTQSTHPRFREAAVMRPD